MSDAYDRNREVRAAVRRNPWSPGSWGKGLVTPTGTTLIWADRMLTDSEGGHLYVDHYDVIEAIGSLGMDEADHIYVDPQGRLSMSKETRTNPKLMSKLHKELNRQINASFT